ncbi:MAG: hypothetical protein P9L97_07255 [Candidatus Tenebribacter davisii]|nr:hypothetical protein [Candidatus Tenebribacter davisii]
MIFFFITVSIILILLFYYKTIPAINGWRKILLISLRSIAFIILLLLLLNPVLFFYQNKSQQPSIVFLNDVSESMQQIGNGSSKLEVFQDLKNDIEKVIGSKNYNIINYNFANGLEGDTKATDISKTFLQLFRKTNPENIRNIFLISDGWFNDENLDIIENQNIPIYTINPHFNAADIDLKILELKHNKSVYKEEITPIEVSVGAINYNGNAKVELHSNEKLIMKKELSFKKNEIFKLNFDVSFSSIGLNPIEVRVNSDSIEINSDNNLANSAIMVEQNRLKALLISDRLNWDVKFIKNAVNSDQHWQSKFLLKNNGLFEAQKEVSFNTEMSEVNVLTLINTGNLNLSSDDVKIINKFVNKGGGLFIIGKPLEKLENILPAVNSGINKTFKATFELTQYSDRFYTFSSISKKDIKNIPPVSYYYINPKVEANILAQFNNDEKSPAILYNKFGKGKILEFAFLDHWKWQLWSSSDSYNDFIHNIFSWLAQTRSERLYATLDKYSFYYGEDIKIDLFAYDETLSPVSELNAEITVTNSKDQIVYQGFMLNENDIYTLKISDLPAEKYKFHISDRISKSQTDGQFIVSEDSPESKDTGINLTLLSYISNKSNGKLIDSAEELEIIKAENRTIKIRNEIPIYKKWYVILIFLLAFCIELFLRKRWGLL